MQVLTQPSAQPYIRFDDIKTGHSYILFVQHSEILWQVTSCSVHQSAKQVVINGNKDFFFFPCRKDVLCHKSIVIWTDKCMKTQL